MAGVFETSDQGTAQASPITVKAGVAPAAKDTFQTEMAIEAGMEGFTQHALGQQESGLEDIQEQRNEALGEIRLKALNEKFDTLSIGVTQGLPTSQANARARALLAETKASVPWIGTRADESFKSFFGGSAAGGGGFTEDPLETAAREHQEKVAGVAASMGVSLRSAQTVVQTEAQNDHAEQILRQRTLSQENNEGAFRDYINSQKQNGGVMVQSIIEAHLQGGNVLDASGIQSVNASISTMANQMKMKLQEQAFDEDGKPKLTQESITQRADEIDKWSKDQKALVGDRSYQDLMKNISETKSYEIAVAAMDTFPVVSLINKAGGQVHVEAYLKGIKDPRYVATLVAAQPRLAAFFDDEGKSKQVTAASLAHAGGQIGITDPDSSVKWARNALSQGGAETSQRFFEDPQNAGVTSTIYNQVMSENPDEAAQATNYHKKAGKISPSETGRTLSSETFRRYTTKNPDEGFRIVASSVEGMSNNFKSAYLDATGDIPDYIEIGSPNVEGGFFTASTSDGAAIPEDARKTLAHTYNTLKSNPQYVEEYEKMLGIPLSAADVMELSINGRVHNKFLDRLAEAEFKGAVRRDIEEKKTKYDGLGIWAKAMKMRSGGKSEEGRRKTFPWVYLPAGEHMIDPAERDIKLEEEPK